MIYIEQTFRFFAMKGGLLRLGGGEITLALVRATFLNLDEKLFKNKG